MNKRGPIIIVEDDVDDQEFFGDAFKELKYKNEILFFSDGQQALDYLTASDNEPFIVFSDINMPKLNGIELRQQIHENEQMRLKTIPYLFFTTNAAQEHVVDAYSKSIQGFFVKPADFEELKKLIKTIIDYWEHCVSPNYVK